MAIYGYNYKLIPSIINALKVLTLTACMGTAPKTVPSMHEPSSFDS